MSRPASGNLKAPSKSALCEPIAGLDDVYGRATRVGRPRAFPIQWGAPVRQAHGQQLRRLQIGQYTAWLRTQTNKH
jgi:hypothetical protein